MAVSSVDGTLEAVTVKRKAAGLWRLADIRIRRPDGTEEVLPGSTVTTPLVGAALEPGTVGRFYLYKSIDHRGIHAVRTAGGKLIAQFPTTNERLMAVLFVLNLVVLAALYAVSRQVSLLALILLPFTGTLFFVYRATRQAAEAQVKADII